MAETLDELLKWTFEDAIEATKKHGDNGGRLPCARWEDAQILKKLENQYLDNDDFSVIPEALYLCMINDFSTPEWLAKAYRKAYQLHKIGYRSKTWDDVFGPIQPKGTHLGAKKQYRETRHKVYLRIKEIREKEPETPIDGYLFERVGKELAIGSKTLTEQYYYSVKNFFKDRKPKPYDLLLKDYIVKSDK